MPNPAQSFADLAIGQDINSVSGRAIYPTSNGGSLASAAGAISGNTTAAVQGGLTVAAAPIVTTSGHTVWWWLGFVGFLVVLMFVARKAGGEEDFRNIRPTFYNFMTITLTAIVGIVGMKVIANKFKIPGASDIILAA